MSARPERFASGRSPLPARARNSWLLHSGLIHSAAEIRTLSDGERTSGEAAGCTDPTRLSPTETWAAQDFRSAKALFVPSLKRDIVPPIACTRPPAGGSHGNPHPTARIHIHTGRRSSCVAARGAGAAAGNAGDRISRRRFARQLRASSGRFPLGHSDGGHPIKVGWREIIREHIRTL